MAALMQRLSIEFAEGICSVSHHGPDSNQSSSLQCQQRWLQQAAGKHKQGLQKRIIDMIDVIHYCHSWACKTLTYLTFFDLF